MAQHALDTAIAEAGIDGDWEYDDLQIRIVKRGLAQVRGQLKDAARTLVRSQYKLFSQRSKVARMRKEYRRLVEDDAYLHEDPEKKTARWYHPCLMEVIRAVFFTKRNLEGIRFRDLFNPIPAPLIALAATAIRGALDEYQTGKFVRQDFTSQAYLPYYLEHIANLRVLDDGGTEFTQMLGSEIWEDCSDGLLVDDQSGRHGKATITEKQKSDAINDAKARRERKRLEQLGAIESDDDM
ncbi:hypothetical protein FRC03_001057 [Tulasnella sp. 419]|nr:hypothetical protein FRC03_001057 [Tulasnella sp. 419]